VQKRPRYGILGGTFDPPHLGHLALAQEVYARLALDRVWFMPAGDPPHKRGRIINAAARRLAMVERAVAPDPRFGVLTLELERAGPSYTADTLRALRALWGAEAHLCLILGWDMLAYLPQWHRPEAVIAQADQIAAVHRIGAETPPGEMERLTARLPGIAAKLVILPAPRFEISGTLLRERVASGLPVRYLVPDAVEEYIQTEGLYLPPARAPHVEPTRGG
jgi:nicotinate-nucleotide adenylyltransferase